MMEPCESCTIAKAKQKSVEKHSETENRATKPGERMYSDLSKIVVPQELGFLIPKLNWHMIVDEYTKCRFS